MEPAIQSRTAPAPVVMKFGGSSVADLDRLRRVASFVVARAATQPVVVVVSAMGKTTDALVESARQLADDPSQREMDMLLTTGERTSMALLSLAVQGAGATAISLTGSQCGIITDHQHGRARIMEVRPFRILDELSAGHIVIVGGFQGVSYKREVTTLGRGGSDTTAVALAAALSADCEIYSDVDGVYSADPRAVDGAKRIDALSYDEMQALSRAGARVLHVRAVELAREKGIAIYARATPSSGEEKPGQTVVRLNPVRSDRVRAVADDPEIIAVRMRFRPALGPSQVGVLARELGTHGLSYLSVDGQSAQGLLSCTQRDDAEETLTRIGSACRERFAQLADVSARADVACVTAVGSGLEHRPDLFERATQQLDRESIPLVSVHADANSLAFVVSRTDCERATRALHDALVD